MSFETSAVLLCFKSAPIITEEHYQHSVIVPMTPPPHLYPPPLPFYPPRMPDLICTFTHFCQYNYTNLTMQT